MAQQSGRNENWQINNSGRFVKGERDRIQAIIDDGYLFLGAVNKKTKEKDREDYMKKCYGG